MMMQTEGEPEQTKPSSVVSGEGVVREAARQLLFAAEKVAEPIQRREVEAA